MAEHITIERPAGIGLATIMARRAVRPEQIASALQLTAPAGPRWTSALGLTLIGIAPGTWLARRDAAPPVWTDDLRAALGDLASVSDQTSAYVLLRLSGSAARTVLQRGAAIDFHSDSFDPGSVVTTAIAHIGVVIRQLDQAPSYELAVFQSYARAFQGWLDRSIAAL